MDYQKITLAITPFHDWLSEFLIAKFGDIGFESFVENEIGFEAYIPINKYSETTLKRLISENNFESILSFEAETIPDQNWNEVWEKNYFKPLIIKDTCLIRAPFHKEFPKCPIEIVIEPNMAFGTGNHETTSLMVESILEENFSGKSVLDMGCGTGILSILASKLGALKVLAIDIDSWSFEGTSENAVINKCDNIVAKHGDASLLGDETFDFVFANIHKNVLINDMKTYAKSMKSGSKLLLSGFYTKDIPSITESAENEGLKPLGQKIKNEWVTLTFVK